MSWFINGKKTIWNNSFWIEISEHKTWPTRWCRTPVDIFLFFLFQLLFTGNWQKTPDWTFEMWSRSHRFSYLTSTFRESITGDPISSDIAPNISGSIYALNIKRQVAFDVKELYHFLCNQSDVCFRARRFSLRPALTGCEILSRRLLPVCDCPVREHPPTASTFPNYTTEGG